MRLARRSARSHTRRPVRRSHRPARHPPGRQGAAPSRTPTRLAGTRGKTQIAASISSRLPIIKQPGEGRTGPQHADRVTSDHTARRTTAAQAVQQGYHREDTQRHGPRRGESCSRITTRTHQYQFCEEDFRRRSESSVPSSSCVRRTAADRSPAPRRFRSSPHGPTSRLPRA